MVGKIDEVSERLAAERNICLSGGSINKRDGRVRIFVKGKFPGAHKSGYALRYRLVWWLRTGEIITGSSTDIHHKDEDRANDSFDNLEKMTRSQHSHTHQPKGQYDQERQCQRCKETFKIPTWRLKDPTRGKFCSQTCYQSFPKELKRELLQCEYCREWFEVLPNRAKTRQFCSNSCAAYYRWSI